MKATLALAALLAVACGARTGLRSGEPTQDASLDGGQPDASADAPDDVVDAPDDVVDAPEDVPVTSCDDAGTTSVYVVTSDKFLFRFDPPLAGFELVGPLSCPSDSIPFSMAVRRNGTAYVLYRDSKLYEVSTQTAACQATPFTPFQLGWVLFGMGFVADPVSGDERLFVAESSYQHPSLGLGYVDLAGFELVPVGPFSSYLGDAVELTGTGEGRLYAFGLLAGGGSTLADVNSKTGEVFNQYPLTIGTTNSSFAFAQWGGDLYFFVSDAASSPTVTYRYQPASGALDPVAKLPSDVVGAGVSTCAPH